MYVVVKSLDQDSLTLFLKPLDGEDSDFRFSLIDDDEGKSLISLKLDGNRFLVEKKDESIVEEDSSLSEKLNHLAISVIEAMQQGKDLTEKDVLRDANNPYNPELIRVETKTFSLRQIYDMIGDEDINLSPDFQRHLVWDDFRKSRLIESILLRIPLPMFYFSQDEEGVLAVVDGLQRLSAIKQFMDNKLQLKNLEYLVNCEGCYYSKEGHAIEDKYLRWFNMTQITANVVDPQSPLKVKYDIFRRINTGGQPLNSQELRNCLAHNNLRRVLSEMADSIPFKEATTWSISDVRMDAQELALRFIYFYDLLCKQNNLNNYSGNIDTELDELVERIGKTSYDDLHPYLVMFENAMENAKYLFGRQAFRKIYEITTVNSGRSPINKALFVSWSVLLSQYDPELIRRNNTELGLIAPLGHEITRDPQLYNYLSYGTNSKANILYAFNSMSEISENNIKH